MQLLLTLGHNSSAILVKDNKVLVGFEEERLSHVKADSSFPTLSIMKIMELFPESAIEVTDIFISHWFWDFELEESKYYKPKLLTANFPNGKITSVDYYNTHHDLHAKSMWNFCDGDNSGLTIVADGFGNMGECVSLYIDGKLDHRCYDLTASLGLMYQYAIGYLGMKENQDEYKLLGYEQQVTNEFKANISHDIEEVIHYTTHIIQSITIMQMGDMYSILNFVRGMWYGRFDKVDNGKKDRARIAYYVQKILEGVIKNLLNHYNIKNIKVSGGVFYNVKLNNMILRYSEEFEANPLSGDQGCALGFTNVRYDNLFWGIRKDTPFFNRWDKASDITVDGYCEILRGIMEFGPRALGNTSTLALPTMGMVEKINAMNGRDTVMPMAPIVNTGYANSNFKDIHKVKKSKYFMIIAFDFIEMNNSIRGAAHYDSDRDVYTGRIQINTDEEISALLNEFGGILINTSLNAHGQPILYDSNDFNTMKRIQSSVLDSRE